jgi:uncharacterized membrane protein
MELNETTGLTSPDPPPRDRAMSGPRRVAATILLSIGLMAAGGVAIVSAASPDPSTSPAATSGGSSGGSSGGGSGGTTNPARTHDCPNMPGVSATPSG